MRNNGQIYFYISKSMPDVFAICRFYKTKALPIHYNVYIIKKIIIIKL